MDAIKKKMEKLSNETADAERRISQFEDIKAVNEQEAEKFEEQLGIIQNKIQNFLYPQKNSSQHVFCFFWRRDNNQQVNGPRPSKS